MAHAYEGLTEREKMFVGLAVTLSRSCEPCCSVGEQRKFANPFWLQPSISMARLLTGYTTFLLMFVVLVPAEGVFLEFNPSPPSAPEAPYGMLLGPSGVCPRINLDI